MKLLDCLLEHTQRWRFVFPQARTLERALALAFGILCGVGKRTLTRAISFQGNTKRAVFNCLHNSCICIATFNNCIAHN